MSKVAGYGGSVTFTNLTAGVRAWEITDNADALETTDFGDSGYRTYLAGLKSWSFTADVVWDSANTAKPGDSASVTLTVTSGKTYTGTAIMTSAVTGVAVDGVVTQRCTFQGSGTLTRPS